MRHKRNVFRQMTGRKRAAAGWLIGGITLSMVILCNRENITSWMWQMMEIGGVQFVEQLFQEMERSSYGSDDLYEKYQTEIPDPAYKRLTASQWKKVKLQVEVKEENKEEEKDGMEELPPVMENVTVSNGSNSAIFREKLKDFDYLMKHFYSIHPTTTADSTLLDAERFLQMDLSLEKSGEQPQILVYHTHSQEEYLDYPENRQATIVGVGSCLVQLLEEKGYGVIHDTNQYDVVDGMLDRSQAYTYALEGITKILQKYPTIEVVLDLHRDGVSEETRLVTNINGKETAQIMFFNGISQTPDGPIEYLPNANREGNLAFSFQMQYAAERRYPEWTRKIYLKGLRYNQHVRARSALIEVGAQTNTYTEALNAMEPLAEVIDLVLSGK